MLSCAKIYTFLLFPEQTMVYIAIFLYMDMCQYAQSVQTLVGCSFAATDTSKHTHIRHKQVGRDVLKILKSKSIFSKEVKK